MWIFAITGITLKAVFGNKYKKLSLAIYILLGWSIVFVLYTITSLLSPLLLLLLLLGGLFYTSGVYFYSKSGKSFYHAVWHMFVLFGSMCHFLAIYYFIK
jgi:hemolysin III